MRRLLLFSVAAVLAFMVTPVAAEPTNDTFLFHFEDNQFFAGDGTGFNNGMGVPDSLGSTPWYYYPNTNWYNQWYDDGPFDSTRWKMITYDINICPGSSGPVQIALNWSTPEYSQEYGGCDLPPLPYFLLPDLHQLTREEEQAWIQRAVIYEGVIDPINPTPPINGTFIIPDYNPEWVSIDIRAEVFAVVDGAITHECMEKIIPAPGAIVLGSIGLGLVSWLRRRRAL